MHRLPFRGDAVLNGDEVVRFKNAGIAQVARLFRRRTWEERLPFLDDAELIVLREHLMEDRGTTAGQADDENRLSNDLLIDLRMPFVPVGDLKTVLQIDEKVRAGQQASEKIETGLLLDGPEKDLKVGAPMILGIAVAEVVQPGVGASCSEQ